MSDGPPDWELHLAVRTAPPPGSAALALFAALRDQADALPLANPS